LRDDLIESTMYTISMYGEGYVIVWGYFNTIYIIYNTYKKT